jgi:hypothetical protein
VPASSEAFEGTNVLSFGGLSKLENVPVDATEKKPV